MLQAYALDRIHKALGFAWVVDDHTVELAKKMVRMIMESVDDSGEYSTATELEDFSNDATVRPLYRWKDKLEVMEFEDGTCS